MSTIELPPIGQREQIELPDISVRSPVVNDTGIGDEKRDLGSTVYTVGLDASLKGGAQLTAHAVGKGLQKAAQSGAGQAVKGGFQTLAKKLGIKAAEKAGVEASKAGSSAVVPGLGLAFGFLTSGKQLYDHFGQITEYAKNTDQSLVWLVFDSEARGHAVRAISEAALNLGCDAIGLFWTPGAVVDFALSAAVGGIFIAKDVGDANSMMALNQLQESVKNGEPIGLNDVAFVTVKRLREAGKDELASTIEQRLKDKDPAVASLLYSLGDAMAINKNVAGTIEYAIKSGELAQQLSIAERAAGQALNLDVSAMKVTTELQEPCKDTLRLMTKLGIAPGGRLLRNNQQAVGEIVANQGQTHMIAVAPEAEALRQAQEAQAARTAPAEHKGMSKKTKVAIAAAATTATVAAVAVAHQKGVLPQGVSDKITSGMNTLRSSKLGEAASNLKDKASQLGKSANTPSLPRAVDPAIQIDPKVLAQALEAAEGVGRNTSRAVTAAVVDANGLPVEVMGRGPKGGGLGAALKSGKKGFGHA